MKDRREYFKKYWAKHKRQRKEAVRRYKLRHRKVDVAHQLVHHAIDIGKLIRKSCEHCDDPNLHTCAHHEDYDKPLEVTWLCNMCHIKRHKEIK